MAAKRRHDLVGAKAVAVKANDVIVGEATVDGSNEKVVCFVFHGTPTSIIMTPAKAKELYEALGQVLRSMVEPGIN